MEKLFSKNSQFMYNKFRYKKNNEEKTETENGAKIVKTAIN